MSDLWILANIAATVIGLIVLIVLVRVDPVVALVLGAVYLGLSSGIGPVETVDTITGGFGDVMTEIGMLIAFGVLIGAVLHEIGAIHRLVDVLLGLFGSKRLPYSLAVTVATTLQSIYIDVLIVITSPLAKSAAARMGPLGLGRMAIALSIGLYCGLTLMVPGAANLALAGLLDVPLGRMLLWGLVVIVPTVLISIAIMFLLVNRGFWNPDKDEQPSAGPAEPDVATDGGGPRVHEQPGAPAGTVRQAERTTALPVLFLPLGLGLVLIAVGSISDAVGKVPEVIALVSNPAIALFVALVGTIAVGRYAVGQDRLESAMLRGFRDSGQILVLTGVGGSLAAVVTASGLGDVLQESFTASTVAPLVVVWAIAAVLHAAIGSVTLAALTAAGILGPVVSELGTDPALVALAAGAGSLFAVHVTANAFWMLQSLLGLTTRGTLKAVTCGVSLASVVALLILLPLSVVV